jgi:hypothetical protein
MKKLKKITSERLLPYSENELQNAELYFGEKEIETLSTHGNRCCVGTTTNLYYYTDLIDCYVTRSNAGGQLHISRNCPDEAYNVNVFTRVLDGPFTEKTKWGDLSNVTSDLGNHYPLDILKTVTVIDGEDYWPINSWDSNIDSLNSNKSNCGCTN